MSENPSGALRPMPLFLAWAVVGFGLSYLWPYPFPLPEIATVAGRVIWVLGAILVAWAELTFWRSGTSDSHSRPTTTVMTTGPFGHSRHPVYLGIVAAMLGASAVYGSVWALVLVIPVVVILQRFTISKEEAYLERAFGDTYRDYQRSVRQWL